MERESIIEPFEFKVVEGLVIAKNFGHGIGNAWRKSNNIELIKKYNIAMMRREAAINIIEYDLNYCCYDNIQDILNYYLCCSDENDKKALLYHAQHHLIKIVKEGKLTQYGVEEKLQVLDYSVGFLGLKSFFNTTYCTHLDTWIEAFCPNRSENYLFNQTTTLFDQNDIMFYGGYNHDYTPLKPPNQLGEQEWYNINDLVAKYIIVNYIHLKAILILIIMMDSPLYIYSNYQ